MASTKLSDCDTRLAEAFISLGGDFRYQTGHDLYVTCTYRSPAEQQVLYAQGRTKPGQIVTQLDGVTHLSNHNHQPSRAIDVCVLVAGKVSWDPTQYAPLGPLATEYGLVWGGSWPHFKDLPHLELP